MNKIKKVILIAVLTFVGIMLVMEFGIKEKSNPVSVTQAKQEVEKVEKESSNEEKAKDVTEEKEPEGEEKEKVVISTSKKGGFMDSTSFIESFGDETARNLGELKYQLGNIRLICTRIGGNSSEGKCADPTYYFDEDPTTFEEAFAQLKDHIPMDAVIQNEFQVDEEKYVYNLKSALLKEKHRVGYPIPPDFEGEFHLVIIKGPEQTVIAAQARIGYYKEK